MTLEELEDTLPNGLHDAEIQHLDVDYAQRKLRLDVAIWVGDMDDPPERREAYKSALVEISGLVYLIMEAPDANYPYRISPELTIDSLDDRDQLEAALLNSLPPGAFCRRFFVNEWNSCIRIAGMNAELSWKNSDETTYRTYRDHFVPGESIDL